MQKAHTIYKHIGETPLETLECFREGQISAAEKKFDQKLVTFWQTVPMTYAGRLDPLAEGELLILIGDECKQKEKYLGADKEYEIDILFGIETDSYDALGLPVIDAVIPGIEQVQSLNTTRYVGKFTQSYPPYSSKTVNGKQLHELARANTLPEEMPEKEVEIYAITQLKTSKIAPGELLKRIVTDIRKVTGDFRQDEITKQWENVLGQSEGQVFPVLSLRVKCSSGTYMRSLAYRLGKDMDTGASALMIKRTKICR